MTQSASITIIHHDLRRRPSWPASDRNGGRLQVGIVAGFKSESPAGFVGICTLEGVAAPARKPRPDETLIKAVVRAHRWRRRIESGQARSITDLAEQEGVTDAYVCRLRRSPRLTPNTSR